MVYTYNQVTISGICIEPASLQQALMISTNGLSANGVDMPKYGKVSTQHLTSELKKMQNRELRELLVEQEKSRAHYTELYDLLPVGYAVFNDKGIICEANLSLASMLGVERSQLLGKPYSNYLNQADSFYSYLRHCGESGDKLAVELCLKLKTGDALQVQMLSVPEYGDQGLALHSVIIDITEHKKTQEEIHRERDQFHRILSAMDNGVYVVNQNCDIQFINSEIEQEFGPIEGRKCYKYFHDLKEVCPWCVNQKVFRGESVHWEWYSDKSGKDYDLFDTPLENPDGSISKLEFFHDISERKKAEEALLDSEEQIRLLLDSTAEAIYGIDLNGNCTLANAACLSMLGYEDASELTGNNMHKLIHHTRPDGSSYPMKECLIYQAFREGKGIHVDDEVLWRKDGSSFPASYWSYPVYRDNQITGSVVTFLDISEQLKARDELAKSHEQLRASLEGTITAVGKSVEARDPYTAGHQQRVTELAVAIALGMGLDEDRVEGIHMGASIHDIGKIHLPAEILVKPSKLSDIEYSLIQTHPQVGYDILKDIDFPWPVADIAHQHHEHMDGSGYPQGLKGEEICLEARIVAVADVVEAISSHRPYRPALGTDAALDEIKMQRGKFYDPEVVDACLKLLAENRFSF
jgi:PAS domain S-box-containing protein